MRSPACVAVNTWPAGAVGLVPGCESRRRPGPSFRGEDSVDGRWSEGTGSLGRNITGDGILNIEQSSVSVWFKGLRLDEFVESLSIGIVIST